MASNNFSIIFIETIKLTSLMLILKLIIRYTSAKNFNLSLSISESYFDSLGNFTYKQTQILFFTNIFSIFVYGR